MARFSKGPRGNARLEASGYEGASAADIARFGTRRIDEAAPDAAARAQVQGPDTGEDAAEEVLAGTAVDEATPNTVAGWMTSVSVRGDAAGDASGLLSLEETDRLRRDDWAPVRRKVALWAVVMVVLLFGSLCLTSWDDGSTTGINSPLEVLYALVSHVTNPLGQLTGWWEPNTAGYSDWHLYWDLPRRLGVIGITLLCAVLLSVSGMLYQTVFKNPIAGPGMLGVSSGVSLGVMLMVYIYGTLASDYLAERYALCYGLGALVLALVIVAGHRMSGKGRPLNIVNMLLLGSVVGQLVGVAVQYVTMYVMDPAELEVYTELAQMLYVDTSFLSWACLIIASLVSLVPVFLLRYRMNALSFSDAEARLLGINMPGLRTVALVCGAIMILAAQIHIGAVALVSLIVPFLSRAWFGCEFRKQLVGSICISTVFLLVCRDFVDVVPFVGQGLGIGTPVALFALPVFMLLMARHLRGWE